MANSWGESGSSDEVKWSEVARSCLTLCDPMDCSPPDSLVHGIFQARILEWGAISFSRGSSQPRDRTAVSYIADRCFTIWATREALKAVIDFILGGLQNHCSYEIKGLLLLERKARTKLDNILKNKDIICQQSFIQLKLWFFQSSMYGCEVWTIKKIERRRIDAFDCGAGDDSWESLGLQRNQTNQS